MRGGWRGGVHTSKWTCGVGGIGRPSDFCGLRGVVISVGTPRRKTAFCDSQRMTLGCRLFRIALQRRFRNRFASNISPLASHPAIRVIRCGGGYRLTLCKLLSVLRQWGLPLKNNRVWLSKWLSRSETLNGGVKHRTPYSEMLP
jgi:hypothetical protein